MIVIDTSALVGIAQREPTAERCKRVLSDEGRLLMSAGTLTEVLIVAKRRNLETEVTAILVQIGVEIVGVTPERAVAAADAYGAFGKGRHPAKLNFGDCFAYALAKKYDCPLLFVGDDFSRTDIRSALASPT